MPDAEPLGFAKPASLVESGRTPRLPETLVARPRLYTLIDGATRSPVTMLVSPAGTGKTTLLAAWAERAVAAGDHDIRWLTADDQLTVAQHLLRAVGVDADQARELADPSRADQLNTAGWLLPALEEALDQGCPRPGLIIIDDAHRLAATQMALLTDIVRKRPEVVRLVLASRRDLALPRAELEVRGAARTFRAGQVRFTDDEAYELVQVHAENLAIVDIQLLQQRAGGWAAALVLGARTLASGSAQEPREPSLAGTDPPVLDFLLGEVYTTLPEATRRILLSTFNEPVITSERAAVLSGDPNAGALLSELASEGLLVTAYAPTTDLDALFRLHPLLIELLRRRVALGGTDVGVVAEAHHRAAVHDAAHGRGAPALRQALVAGDPDLLAELLVEHGVTLLCAGQEDAVDAALAKLPADGLDRFPQVLGVAGLYRRTVGDVAGAVLLAARASNASQRLETRASYAPTPQDDALRADALLLRLWQSRFGWQDADDAIASAHEILGPLAATARVVPGTRTLVISPARVAWLMIELAAVEVWVGDLPSAASHVDEAVLSARAVGHQRLLAAALSHRALIEFIGGSPQTATVTAEEALALAADAGVVRDAFLDRAHLVLGWSALFRLELEEVEERLAELAASRSARLDVVVATYTRMLQSVLMAESARVDEARQLLGATPEAPERLPEFLLRGLALLRLRFAATVGDAPEVAAQLSALSRAGSTLEIDLFKTVAAARAGDDAGAIVKLERLLDGLARKDAVLAAVAAAERVALLHRAGDRPAANDAMNDLLGRIAPQRLVYAMTAASLSDPGFLQLLAEQSHRRDPHPFAARALETLSRYHEGSARSRSLAAAPRSRVANLHGFQVRLTTRETDVLEQLALGGSYTDIGRALYITENTVKTHLASLYRKLGADRRSAALRVARSLGMI